MPATPQLEGAPKLPARVNRLIQDVCGRHDITPADVFSEYADREVVECRSEILFRLRYGSPPIGVSQLARWFGKSRTTVMDSLARHKRLRHLARRGAFT